ncbi:hypothetical protein ACFE04_003581 [Oxalis oulophora]
MADFGFLSDSDNSAIDEIITQAAELSVLEQVAKINCSGFTDSVLPTQLESRFRKLKSLPVVNNSAVKPTKRFNHSKSELTQSVTRREKEAKTESDEETKSDPDDKVYNLERKFKDVKGNPKWENESDEESEIFSASKQNSDGKAGSFVSNSCSKGRKTRSLNGKPNWESESDEENEIFSAAKQKADRKSKGNGAASPYSKDEQKKPKPKSKSKSGFVTSPLESSNSWMDSPSSPRKSSCFPCSPIRFSKKKSKDDHMALGAEFDWDNTDEFLSDLNTFSIKKQQKKLKMAMKEQEKVSKEAEKIVKWAKQASARMSVHGIEDELSLSDNESTK